MKTVNLFNTICSACLFSVCFLTVIIGGGVFFINHSPSDEDRSFDSLALGTESVYVPVLVYHHFVEEGSAENGLIVSASAFDDQMYRLKEEGYSAVTADQLIDYVDKGTPLPEKPVLITFDDGYTSNLEIAAPILEKYDMHAIIFVIGIFAGESEDPRSGVSLYPPRFGWDDALPWVEKGVLDIQCHSYDMHRVIAEGYTSRDGMLRAEGERSSEYAMVLKEDFDLYRSTLSRNLGTEMKALAFPFGYISNELLLETKKNGIRISFSTEVGGNFIVSGNSDSLHCMNRINIYDNTTGEDLISVLEYYSHPKDLMDNIAEMIAE